MSIIHVINPSSHCFTCLSFYSIFSLAISDLGVSVNRRQMVGFLNEASAVLQESLHDARKSFEETGGKVMVFGPGVPPPKTRS